MNDLHINNSDGSDPETDAAPLGLAQVSTAGIVGLYVLAFLFFLAVPSVAAWLYF